MIEVKEEKPVIDRVMIRKCLLELYDGQCYYCKKILTLETCTIDHYKPKSKGGEDTLDNFRPACLTCNQSKGDSDPDGAGWIALERTVKRAIAKAHRPVACGKCNDGRLLNITEICDVCGSGAGPVEWPHALKVRPGLCDHGAKYWCWVCASGIEERTGPLVYDALQV